MEKSGGKQKKKRYGRILCGILLPALCAAFLTACMGGGAAAAGEASLRPEADSVEIMETETEMETKTEPAAETETEMGTEAEPAAETETEMKTEAEPAAEAGSEPETEAEPAAEAGSEPETEADPAAEIEAETETEAETIEPESIAAQSQEAEDESSENSAEEDGSGDNISAEIENMLQEMSLEEKVDQLFVLLPEALTGTDRVTRAGDATREAVRLHPVGGIIYMEGNIETPGQVKEMLAGTKAIYAELGYPEPMLVTDEEGGTVARIAEKSAFGVENVGNMRDIGAAGDPERAAEAGAYMASYLKELGFNTDFAPVADVLTNPDNTVVKYRSFGSDPDLVTEMVRAEAEAMLAGGILPVLKHFPGHGATSGDTHEGFAYTEKTLEELYDGELKPFIGSLSCAPMIMTAHISLPNVTGDDRPASLSYAVVTELLREQLGYDGVIITDALNMGAVANTWPSSEAAVLALEAGNDMLLMPYSFSSARQGVLDAVAEGRIPESRIDDSVRRILLMKQGYRS